MKVAIYARVSTSDQSPDLQLRELRAYAARRNFEVAEEFIDIGISGKKQKRPALNRLMDGARKRHFDAILVWKFDRWARSVRHLVDTLEECQSLGIQFLSYTENIDTSTPMGAAMFSVAAAMAQLERDLIRERTVAALAAIKAKGKKLGPPTLNLEAEVLALRQSGLSYRKIAEALNVSAGYAHKVAAQG